MKKKNKDQKYVVVDKDFWNCTAVGWEHVPEEFIYSCPEDLIYDIPTITSTGFIEEGSFIYLHPIETDEEMEDIQEIYGPEFKIVEMKVNNCVIQYLIPQL